MPNFDHVKATIKAGNTINDPIEKALFFFDKITREQWFNNGNKRTATMVANHVLLQNNCAVFAIPVEEKSTFMQNLVDYYETENANKFNSYLYNTAIEHLPSGLTWEQLLVQKQKGIHQVFADWKDDGIRDHELNWGEAKGNELPW